MKKVPKIVVLIVLALAIASLFLPIVTFSDNSAASMDADITKQEERVASAQDKLQRWIEGGKKSESDIEKQKAQVQKEQDKLDALIAEKEAANTETGAGLQYSMLPIVQFPEDIKLNQAHVNQNQGYYPVDQTSYYVCVYVSAGLLVLALLFNILSGNKLVSVFYTLGTFATLGAILTTVYSVLRVLSYPVALPYGNAQPIVPVMLAVLLLPVIAFAIQVTTVRNSKRSMIYVFCILLSIMALLPFWIMIVNATRSSAEIQASVSLIPSHFLERNWGVLQSKNFNIWVGFLNSAIIAFGSTILGVLFSALTAYGFKVYNFKGNKFLWAVVMAIIMIPGQITGTGFYMFMFQLGLTNSYIPLIIPAIASASTVFFFRQYLEANFQVSLVEAGRIDGAGELHIFWKVVLPIMVPAMCTMGIMAVIGSWNNYLTPLMLLSKAEMKTLPMMVKELRGDIYRTEYGSIYLGLTLTAMPLLIVYFSLSKYIIAGVALGGVKE